MRRNQETPGTDAAKRALDRMAAYELLADFEGPIFDASSVARLLVLVGRASVIGSEDLPALAWLVERLEEATGSLEELFRSQMRRPSRAFPADQGEPAHGR